MLKPAEQLSVGFITSPTAHAHVAFAGGGHAAMFPLEKGAACNGGFDNLGRTETENATARAGRWKEAIELMANHLGKPKPASGGDIN